MEATGSAMNFKEAWKNNSEIFVLYRYEPSLQLAVTAFICFFILTVLHTVQAWRYRAYYFIPFIFGGLFEWLGYVGRIFAHYDQYALGIYVWQTLLLLLAPTLMVATIYMILSKIITTIGGETHSPFRVSWLTKIFVCGDILSFLVQGGGMPPIVACLRQYISMVNNNGPPAQASIIDTGRNMVVAGLILQVLFFSTFLITVVVFHYRMVREQRSAASAFFTVSSDFMYATQSSELSDGTSSTSRPLKARGQVNVPYQRYLYTLYLTGILILIRSLFRIVEFMEGHAGKLMAVEWYLYVFDALLMVGLMLLFNIWHPGRISGRVLVKRGEAFKLDDSGEELKDTNSRQKMVIKEAGRVGPMA